MALIGFKSFNPFLDEEYVYKYYDLFGLLYISDINLLREEIALVTSQIAEVQNLNKQNFMDIRAALKNERDKIADACGVVDIDYNRVYDRVPGLAVKALDVSDIFYTQNLQDSIRLVEYVLFNMSINEKKPIDPFLLAKTNANNPNFDMSTYTSGRLVAFHYQDTLQDLAYRYLGSRDKWMEIAIANGLQPPFIDEIGEKIIIINAYENSVIIPEFDSGGLPNIDKVYFGQPIQIKSVTERVMDQRIIENVIYNSTSHSIVLTLNGEHNLSKYHVADAAYIRVFKPNTINSNFMILIPVNEPLPFINKETPWFLATSAQDEKNQGIDIYIDNDTKEIYFDSSNDLKLSYGLTNAFQALTLKVSTEAGSLKRHPNWGLELTVGFKNNNIARAKSVLVNKIMAMVEADPRFERLVYISAEYNNGNGSSGNAILIKMVVKLSGSGTPVPITFTINL